MRLLENVCISIVLMRQTVEEEKQVVQTEFKLCVRLSCRTHDSDEETSSQLMIQDKRRKQDASSLEEELLLSHRLLVRRRRGRNCGSINVFDKFTETERNQLHIIYV